MRIVLINLERSADRLAAFRKRNAFLSGFERFQAVDGRLVDRQRLIAEGALGCALSHMTAWRQIERQGVPASICEDDAVLHCDFERQAAALMTTLPADWDLVLWGWNFDAMLLVDLLPGVSPSAMRFNQALLRRNLDRYQSLALEPRALRVLSAFGSLRYAVSPLGARRLLAACAPIRPISVQHQASGPAHRSCRPHRHSGTEATLTIATSRGISRSPRASPACRTLPRSGGLRTASTSPCAASPVRPAGRSPCRRNGNRSARRTGSAWS